MAHASYYAAHDRFIEACRYTGLTPRSGLEQLQAAIVEDMQNDNFGYDRCYKPTRHDINLAWDHALEIAWAIRRSL